jgi:hypothetical protein
VRGHALPQAPAGQLGQRDGQPGPIGRHLCSRQLCLTICNASCALPSRPGNARMGLVCMSLKAA